jgi:deoxyribodipyrimidine photolyase
MAAPVIEEAKMLSEALNTVKIQVQQMKRHLVRQTRSIHISTKKLYSVLMHFCESLGARPAYGCIEEC